MTTFSSYPNEQWNSTYTSYSGATGTTFPVLMHYPTTPSTPTLDPHAVNNLLMSMHRDLTDARAELHRIRSEVYHLRGAIDWTSKNPGMTLDDYQNYLRVSKLVTEAAKDGQEKLGI